MTVRTLLCAVGWLLAGALAGAAQEKGNWRAASKTAQSITGDVTLSEYKIGINFSAFTIAQIRTLKPDEMGAVFSGAGTAGGGNLYRLSIPAAKQFLHRNTICGSEETQWMATDVAGKTLQLAFFSGESMPVFTAEAIGSSTSLCGTFSYVS